MAWSVQRLCAALASAVASTEHDFTVGSAQNKFIEADLASVSVGGRQVVMCAWGCWGGGDPFARVGTCCMLMSACCHRHCCCCSASALPGWSLCPTAQCMVSAGIREGQKRVVPSLNLLRGPCSLPDPAIQ